MWKSSVGEHREDIKQGEIVTSQLKDDIFRQQLITALNKLEAEKAKDTTYAEKVDKSKYTVVNRLEY